MIRRSIWPTRAPLPVPPAPQYFFPVSQSGSSTAATLGVGTLRVAPFLLEVPLKIDKIGAEITSAGEAGAKLRLGMYADDGTGYPGALVLDAGTINGDSATVQEITLGATLTLPPGIYWVGGAVQVVVTTQPTVRTTSQASIPFPIRCGTTAPTSGTTVVGNTQSSVTGALPSNFTVTALGAGSAPLIRVRAA